MSLEIKAALKNFPGFGAVGESVIENFLPFASIRHIRAGETIFCQGEPSPFCFGIISGEIMIQRVTKNSRFPPKLLGTLQPGQLFGESAILEDSPRAAMASASRDGKLVVIRGPQLREWLRQHPEAAQPLLLELFKTSLNRMQRTSEELAAVCGIGRLLGSGKSFVDQAAEALEFIKTSFSGIDDLVIYQRSPYWDEFSPLVSLPLREDLPAIPWRQELADEWAASKVGRVFDPKTHVAIFGGALLPWSAYAALAILPFFDWDKEGNPLQGLMLLASSGSPDAFSAEKHLLLTSISHPLSEALARYARQTDVTDRERLQRSRHGL